MVDIDTDHASRPIRAIDNADDADDADLLRRSRAGDATAFGLLYDRHRRAAFGRAYRILNELETAEDVIQEAFFTLWLNAGAYKAERGSVRSLLLTMVHHRAIDTVRRRHDDVHGLSDTLFLAPAAETREATYWEVRDALQRLPPDQRSVVTLCYVGGYTHDEIARLLALPPGTVKSRVRLGLKKLRRYLGADFPLVAC